MCPTGKVSYPTMEAAARAVFGGMHVYRCPLCRMFHVGHPDRSGIVKLPPLLQSTEPGQLWA